MSRYDDAFEMENGQPILNVNVRFGDHNIQLHMDYDTTAVFTHPKQFEHLDHVFVELSEDEGRTLGAFIWRQVLPDWEDLKKALDDRDFHHIHSPYPSEADVEQYNASNLPESTPKVPPKDTPSEDANIIVEAEDEDVVTQAMANWDEEWRYYSGEA